MTPAFARWRLRSRVPLAMLSGILLSLAFPPVDLRWFAFVGLVPLMLALRGATIWQGIVTAAAWALAFFGVIVVWLAIVDWYAWGALVLLMISIAVLFGAFAAPLGRGGVIARIAGWPLLFTGVEMLRARYPLGGFTFGSLGASQYSGLPLLPLARVGGMFTVTLALVLINALLAEAVASPRKAGRVLAVVAAAGLALAPVLLPVGAVRSTKTMDVAMVQGNVPQHFFRGLRRGRVGPEDNVIVQNHLLLTRTLAAHPPQLVLWPENSLDRDPFTDPIAKQGVADALAAVKAPLLVGAILDAREPGRFTNTDLLFAPDGSVAARYDKVHLVPFGEYVPWGWARRWIPALRAVAGDGIPGPGPVVMRYGDLPAIGPVICFESTYPHIVRDAVRAGAEVIVVSTNNASFERSSLARQHLAQSVMRAVETGRPVLHNAIAGISAVITPTGDIVQSAGLFLPAIVRQNVTGASGFTPYVRYGAIIEAGIGGGAALAALLGILLAARRKVPGFPIDDDDEFWITHGAPIPVDELRREPDEEQSQ